MSEEKEIIITNIGVEFRGVFSESDIDELISQGRGMHGISFLVRDKWINFVTDLRHGKAKRQTRSEILQEFYRACVDRVMLPELSFVNEVSSLLASTRDKLSRILDAKSGVYGVCEETEREKVISRFYRNVIDILDNSTSFLRTAPLLRIAILDCTFGLENIQEPTTSDENGTHQHPIYQWRPQEDITPYELALCMPVLSGYSIYNAGEKYYIEAMLPKEARRHFKRQA